MDEQLETKKCRLQRWISTTLTVALILAVVMCLYIVIQVLTKGYANVGGFMMFRVVTGSMEPTIPTGALLIAQEVDIGTVRMDDIVCFRTQLSEIWGKIVTHRVIGIEVYETGVREMLDETGAPMLDEQGDVIFEEYPLEETSYYFQTKGDANDAPDGAPVYYKNVVGIPRLTIPYLGYLAQWLQTRQGMILGISIALVIIILTFLPDLLKLVDEPADKKQEAAAAEAAEQAGETDESNAAEGE